MRTDTTRRERANAERRLTREKRRENFVKAALRTHGDRFSYTDTDYRRHTGTTRVWCRRHAKEVTTTPKYHLRHAHGGCDDCAREGYTEARAHFVEHPATRERDTVEGWAARRGVTPEAMRYRLKHWDTATALAAGKHEAYHRESARV